jgi:hypothetical protein
MAHRLDFLKECNDQQVPLEDFRLQFCARCVQPECTRSTHGTSKFDQRVTTWEQRLFTEVPRMESSDPRFEGIQGKMFKMFSLPVQQAGAKSDWMDPRDLVEPTPQPHVDPPAEPEEEEPIPPTEPEFPEVPESPSAPPPVAAVSTQPPVKATTSKLSPAILRMNTPSQSGRMLAGNPAPTPKDPWAGPAAPANAKPNEGGVVIVKRGATVRLGGNGVE